MQVKEAKSPVKNLVRQRCADGFNSGVKGLMKRRQLVVSDVRLHETSPLIGTEAARIHTNTKRFCVQ
jgi:hypothetical protein